MIAIAKIKKPHSIARAMFCFSKISFRMLCFGVNHSIKAKATKRITIPKTENTKELIK